MEKERGQGEGMSRRCHLEGFPRSFFSGLLEHLDFFSRLGLEKGFVI